MGVPSATSGNAPGSNRIVLFLDFFPVFPPNDLPVPHCGDRLFVGGARRCLLLPVPKLPGDLEESDPPQRRLEPGHRTDQLQTERRE